MIMRKGKSNVNDARLKARRTSLEKKDKKGLIDIILRKDDVERRNNSKIQQLTQLLNEADELIEEKNCRIDEKDMIIKDKTIASGVKNTDIEILKAEVSRLKDLCNFRRKAIIYIITGYIITIVSFLMF